MATPMQYNNTYTVSIPSIAAQLVSGGIGWNQHFASLHSALADSNEKYPPHNIIKTDDERWLIELAVAGFDESDLEITVQNSVLTIKGKSNDDWHEDREWVHHGIKIRDFEKTFPLAEHVDVKEASYNNGLLNITLERQLPKELQPKTIKIK